jgi:hypothetical protein
MVTTALSPGCEGAQGTAGLGVATAPSGLVTCRVTKRVTSTGTSIRMGVAVAVGELPQPKSHTQANSSKRTRQVFGPCTFCSVNGQINGQGLGHLY